MSSASRRLRGSCAGFVCGFLRFSATLDGETLGLGGYLMPGTKRTGSGFAQEDNDKTRS